MRRKICLPKKGLAFRMSDKRVSLSVPQSIMTLLMHFVQLSEVLQLRLGSAARSTNAFRLGFAQDDGFIINNFPPPKKQMNDGVGAFP
jgi:hypothetical protein